MNKYKRICYNCNTDFISSSPYKKYCNRDCKISWNEKNIYSYNECITCNKSFRKLNNTDANKFCSKKCYFERTKSHPEEFGLTERAKKAFESWSEKSWKKGIETRIKNGNIINWDKAEWKQYWRKCNDLTRKIRKKMLEDWDGYDYIDGEYIKDYLNLHYSDKNYPTLDHIKPRSQCFREGLSPHEATIPSNLKWTKRINNSKKSQKQLNQIYGK
jgi:hypothetical protein